MGFHREYTKWIGTDSYCEHNEILTTFFGFSTSTEDDTRLRNTFGGSTYLEYKGNGKFVEKSSPIGSYYSEKTGTRTKKLTRRYTPNATEQEFEDRFIEAMHDDVTCDSWVWKPMRIPYSAASIYGNEKPKSRWPKIVSCIVMTIILAICAWFFVGATCAKPVDRATWVNVLIIIGSALGLIFAYVIGYGAGFWFDFSPRLDRCSKETQIAYGLRYFAEIDHLLPYNANAARVLKEFAIYRKLVHPETPLTASTTGYKNETEQKKHQMWATEAKQKRKYILISTLVLVGIIGAFLLMLFQKADALYAAVPSLKEVVDKYRATDPTNLQASPVYNVMTMGGLISLCTIVIYICTFFDVDTGTFWGKVFVGVCIVGAAALFWCCSVMQCLGMIWIYWPVAFLVFLLCHKMLLSDD